MVTLEKDRWYVRDNTLSISLMRFHAAIEVINIDEETLLIRLSVHDSDMRDFHYAFKTLEESIDFVENQVNKSYTLEEVSERYQDIYLNDKKIKKLGGIRG